MVDTPTRYGTPGDVLVTDAQDELIDAAVADPEVDAVLESWGFNLLVESHLMQAILPEILTLQGCEQPPQFHPEGDAASALDIRIFEEFIEGIRERRFAFSARLAA